MKRVRRNEQHKICDPSPGVIGACLLASSTRSGKSLTARVHVASDGTGWVEFVVEIKGRDIAKSPYVTIAVDEYNHVGACVMKPREGMLVRVITPVQYSLCNNRYTLTGDTIATVESVGIPCVRTHPCERCKGVRHTTFVAVRIPTQDPKYRERQPEGKDIVAVSACNLTRA